MFGARAAAGFDLGKDRYLLGAMRYAGRLESGELRDGRLALQSSFYLRHSDWSVFYAGLNGEFGSRLDSDRQILLGGDNGLRGYPLRFQAGSARALVTLEERFYTRWRPFELFQVGAAVFFDAGRAWGGDPVATSTAKVLKDVGFGLRFGTLRSGLGNVIHVDVAYPLDRAPGMDGVQIVVETKNSF
jgi:hemolysin activation/secretion protein